MKRLEDIIHDALQHSYDEMQLPDNWQSNIPNIDTIIGRQKGNTEEQNISESYSEAPSERIVPEIKESCPA